MGLIGFWDVPSSFCRITFFFSSSFIKICTDVSDCHVGVFKDPTFQNDVRFLGGSDRFDRYPYSLVKQKLSIFNGNSS